MSRSLRIALVRPDGRRVSTPLGCDDPGHRTVLPVGAGCRVEVRLHCERLSVSERRVEIELEALDAPVELNALVEASTPAADPWWLIPGLFYGENRPADCGRQYPRFAHDSLDDLTSPAWSFRMDRAASPVVFGWGEQGGIALETEPTSEMGMPGIGFAHDQGVASVHAVFPYAEAPVTYYGDDRPRPAMREHHRLVPGEPVRIAVRVHDLDQDRHGYAPILRRRWQSAAPTTRAWVDLDDAADLTTHGLVDHHWDPTTGILDEAVSFDGTQSRGAMHVGWVSGIPWAYALLAHGWRCADHRAQDIARAVIDMCCSELAPSGTFWGCWYEGKGWRQSWTPIRGGLHARTLGEATHFLVRAIVAERDHGYTAPSWLTAVESNLRAVATRQRPDGNLGAVHHAVTGEVLSWSGAAGLAWIPAFVEATEAGLGDWLEHARAAGLYYSRFVRGEFLHGAPEDVDLAPTSEDGYAAVMAYMALHRADPGGPWLALARRAADWTLTFRYDYDVAFEPSTMLGLHRFGTRGADQASPSNQHVHNYGLICTQEMLDLSKATGDPYYAARQAEALDCWRQLIARYDGDLTARRGMVSERPYQTECFAPKGGLLPLSHAWCVGVTLLACEQVIAAQEAQARLAAAA